MLGRPGLLAGALGPSASVTATVKPQGAGKAAGGAMTVDAQVRSPKLNADAALAADNTRFALAKPMDLKWTLDPAWAAANLFGGDAKAAGFALTKPVELTGQIERLTIARNAGGPLKPGVFDLSAKFAAPSVAMITSDGDTASMSGVDLALKSAGSAAAPAIGFDLGIAGVASSEQGQAGSTAGRSTTKGVIANIADATGKLTSERATITMESDATLPTPLVDALTNQKGGLVELLGPTVTVKATTSEFSRQGGRLSLDATAPRATAKVKGRVQGGVFYAEEPVTARVFELTPEFTKRTFEAAMPLLSNLEKRKDDGPAVFTAKSLELPMTPEIDTDGDGKPDAANLRKLNGDMRLELGTMRYAASKGFGQVLKATKNNTEGKLFGKFPPLDVAVRQGVATYDRTRFPVGEFEIETRGKVDLADKTMDLILYLPIGAVADEVIGIFKLAPGLDQLTMLPFRMKGKFGEAVPVPAPDLVAKELLKSPEDLIKGAGGLIEDLLKKKKK